MGKREKFVLIVGDGMADYPVAELGGRTPLRAAKTPHLDRMALHGELGLVRTVPEGFVPGSEIANLSILGYDPTRYYTGRGPLEAASLGVKLGPQDLAFRCNLVTLRGRNGETVMDDFCAGHITDPEASAIIADLDGALGSEEFRFYAGVSYRHLMIWKEGARKFPGLDRLELTPPHDIIGRGILPFLPVRGNGATGSGAILSLMEESRKLLGVHPVNLAREAKGLAPANAIWLWGQGRSPQMPTLKERFGIEGAVISAVHLLKGIGILAGLEVLEVPGATGYFDTNYDGKAKYALESLRRRDFIFVHVEAPDEAGHLGDPRIKVETIEAFDEKIVGAILRGMEDFRPYRIMVLPDHPTTVSLRTHSADPVPFVICASEGARENSRCEGFDETAAAGGILVEKGHELIERFLS